MITYLRIAQIVVAVALIAVVLLQSRGTGLGGIFGGELGVYKSRRGLERTLFQATIILAGIFFVVSVAAVALQPSA